MTKRMYKGFELQNVGLSWYLYGIHSNEYAGRWIGKSFAEAKRWVDTNMVVR
jgi:hypothetical protein